MDKKYLSYSATDFAGDDLFLAWRLQEDPDAGLFWNKFIEQYPEKLGDIDDAVRLLGSVRMNHARFSDSEMAQEQQRLRRSVARRRSGLRLKVAAVSAAVVLLAIGGVALYEFSGDADPWKAVMALQNKNDEPVRIERGGRIVDLGDLDGITYDEQGNIRLGKEEYDLSAEQNGRTDRLIVPHGKRFFVTLSDNSRVWINSGTTVTYPLSFAGDTREITVEGEVYVEIERDEARPFIIHTQRMSVRVLGTSFNISDYGGEASSSVVLVNGAVEVSVSDGRTVALAPNDMLTVTDGGISLDKVDLRNHISWKEGMLRFSDRPLADVLAYLSRYYGILIEAHGTEGITITGSLILFDDLNTVLENFTVIAPVSIRADSDKITVQTITQTK